MKSAVRTIPLGLAYLYMLAWLLLPNLILLHVHNESHPSLPVFMAVLTAIWLFYFALFSSARWFGLVNIPFALFSGAYAGHIYIYKSIPYEGMWFSIWDMVYLEMVDLGLYYLDMILLNLACFAVYLACVYRVSDSQQSELLSKARKPVLLACLVSLFGYFIQQNFLFDEYNFGNQEMESAFIHSYPMGMAYQAYSTWNLSGKHDRAEYESLPELERTAAPLPDREIYVLVIGETARSDRWLADFELNHYQNLESDNAVAFPNAFSQANFTDGSLHLLLTGSSSYRESEGTSTLPLISRAGGCQTIWISNNKEYRYAWHADYSIVTEQTTSTPLAKRFDHAMLPSIYRAILQGEKRVCVIVHLLGSHFSYHHRYDSRFTLKDVDMEDYDNKFSDGHRQALRNAYDNSIHATNDFLERLVTFVKSQSANALVMYTSDHGENLYDDSRELFQHIMRVPSRYEVEVPFLVWVSDRFVANYPDKWAHLNMNAQRPVSNRQILPTFIDLLEVRYEKAHFSDSLLSSYENDPLRYVLAPDMQLLTETEIK